MNRQFWVKYQRRPRFFWATPTKADLDNARERVAANAFST